MDHDGDLFRQDALSLDECSSSYEIYCRRLDNPIYPWQLLRENIITLERAKKFRASLIEATGNDPSRYRIAKRSSCLHIVRD